MSRRPFIGLFFGLFLGLFFALFLWSLSPIAAVAGESLASLSATVSETSETVRVRVQVVGEIEPGSLEVGFEGRKAVISARDAGGQPLRPARVQLPAPVMEDGATAETDAGDALVITLRKQRAAGAPSNDLDANAR